MKTEIRFGSWAEVIEIQIETEALETEIIIMESETFQDDIEYVASKRIQRRDYGLTHSMTQNSNFNNP